jgi:hypothetical protein
VKIMRVQETKRQIQVREWAKQVNACNRSGLPVSRWCKENGVAKKSYYYHLKRVREEMLDGITAAGAHAPRLSAGDGIGAILQTNAHIDPVEQLLPRLDSPVFVTLPVPQLAGSAVTVRIGGYAVDVQNGADDAVIEQVLRVVTSL